MCKIRCYVYIFLKLAVFNIYAQSSQQLGCNDSITILNSSALSTFYNALGTITSESPVHVICIGDSHLQAGMLSDSLRKYLQNQYGNAGRGLCFPYTLAKTNGPNDMKIYCNSSFIKNSILDKHNYEKIRIGISGYGLKSTTHETQLFVSTTFKYKDMKIIGDTGIHVKKNQPFKNQNPVSYKYIVIQVKKGDTWSKLTKRYKISKAEIIRQHPKYKTSKLKPGTRIYVKLKSKSEKTNTPTHLDSMPCLTINKNTVFDGLYFTNNSSGLLLSSIGVNGATMKKYLNHPEFFSALTQLKPQLVILWFGTNESYSNYTPENFKNDLIQMQSKIKSSISNVSILVITPPLSLLKNHESNTVLNHYSDGIISLMKEYHFAVLPVFEFLKQKGGMSFLKKEQLIAKDNVHYTRKGYTYLAQLIFNGLQVKPKM